MSWKGPMPCTCTIDSPFLAVHAKCGILAGSRRYEPAGSSRAPRLRNFSPIAKYIVPLTTVTCSSVGCQCGGTLAPAGCRIRMTKGPAFSGSPESTASFAPAPPGGEGRHLISPGASMTCAARASGGGAGAAAGSVVPGGEPVACLRLLDDLAAGERVRRRGEEEDQGGPAHQSLCPCRARAQESPAGLASRNRRAARVGRKPRTVSMVSASSGLLSVR